MVQQHHQEAFERVRLSQSQRNRKRRAGEIQTRSGKDQDQWAQTKVVDVPPKSDEEIRKGLEKLSRRQRWMDQVQKRKDQGKREEQWCQLLEETHPITPGLLKACFVDLNFDQLRIDSGK